MNINFDKIVSDGFELMTTFDGGRDAPLEVMRASGKLCLKYMSFYESRDWGETWEEKRKGLPAGDLEGLFSKRAESGTFYFEKHRGTLYYWSKRFKKWIMIWKQRGFNDSKNGDSSIEAFYAGLVGTGIIINGKGHRFRTRRKLKKFYPKIS